MIALQSIAEIIRGRTSVKAGYLEKEVSQDLVVSLLRTAVWAPNHGLREPWRFIFVAGERKQDFIDVAVSCHEKSKQEGMREKLSRVPAFLIVIMKEDPRQKQWEENFAATSCMLQNFQLLAWEQNLGTVWKTPQHIHDPKFRNALGVQFGEKIVGILHIGYFDKQLVAKKVRKRTDPAEKLVVF